VKTADDAVSEPASRYNFPQRLGVSPKRANAAPAAPHDGGTGRAAFVSERFRDRRV